MHFPLTSEFLGIVCHLFEKKSVYALGESEKNETHKKQPRTFMIQKKDELCISLHLYLRFCDKAIFAKKASLKLANGDKWFFLELHKHAVKF